MIRKCLPLPLAAFAILTTFLFACLNVTTADTATDTQQETQNASSTLPENSVLHLIPEKTLGFIYCPDLLELDGRINIMKTELLPQTGAPDVPTKILSDGFESLFKNLTGLEETGVDLRQDFALLLTNLKPPQLALLAHLTDPKPMRQMIETKMNGDDLVTYKDVTYWNDSENGRNFVLLGKTLVVSKQREVCENIIDTYNGTMKAALKNPDYVPLFTDISDDVDQLAVYFDVESAIATLDRPLEEELESIMDNLEDDHEMFDAVVPFLEGISKNTASIEQVRHASLRLHIKSTDIQIKPFLKFKNNSEYLEMLKAATDELVFLSELPNQTFMNAAFQGSPEFLTETGKLWFGFFPKDTPEQRAKRDVLLEQTKGFYESLASRWSFSLTLGEPSLPVFIYELKDEQRVRTYMDEVFLEKLGYTEAYSGQSIMHNRVEIKSYVFPNFKVDAPEAAPETSDLVSSEWHWYYAFTEGQLLFTMGTDPTSMQMVLDRKAGTEEKFADHPSYQKLVDNLGTDNNVLLAISPTTAIKTIMSLAANMDPNNAELPQLFWGIFSTLPENYSIGLSAKARDSGIDANLFVNLADFKQLGQMFLMMGRMIQMQ